ncbi:MAG TPA: YkgJ family cysteine cluster protein [Acidobacteriaceae bacterium]|nr:YkgJ family cysteine cluster protein [Acidobacteriaceae bacterium]
MEDEEIHARDLHLVQITDAAFADAARRSGSHLACRPGCTQCCHGAFAIHALDALRLQKGFYDLAQRDPERAEAVKSRARAYIHAHAQNFPGDSQTGILGESDAEKEAFEGFANDDACPVLDPATGLCDLYEARPMTCRLFGPPVRSFSEGEEGLALCELCFTEASEGEIAAAEMHPPHAEEAALLEDLFETGPATGAAERGETIVAWALIPSKP